MDQARQTFRCGDPWWLKLCIAGLLSNFSWQFYFQSQREGLRPREANFYLVMAAAIAVGAAFLLVLALRRWWRPYEIVLDDKSIHLGAILLLRPAESIDYDQIDKVKREGTWAPRITIFHKGGAANIMGSRFRSREFDALSDELSRRVGADRFATVAT